jgi:hypothetical protein
VAGDGRDAVTRRVPVLLVVAYLLMGTAWVVTNPPGAAPDEYAHYLKALAAGRGQLYLGRRVPPRPDVASLDVEERWQLRTSRLVHVPFGLHPGRLLCSAFHPEISAGCLHPDHPGGPFESATIIGTYQPFTYVVPGLLMRLAHDPQSATRFGRMGFWLFSAALLGLAVVLLWSPDDGGFSLVGVLVATTPMVLFMVSTLSANGLEISAGICFSAALLRLARGGDRRWVWIAAGASGALLVLSRVTGVLWLGLASLAVAALVGVRPAAVRLRNGGTLAVGAIVAAATAAVASLAWELAVQPHPRRSLGAAVRDVPEEVRELPDVLHQVIGVFGWLDTRMSRPLYLVWELLVVALIALALVVGTRRQRVVLCALAGGSLAVTVGLAVLNRPTGFGAQGRYVLAFVSVVPLAAGEILFANRHRLRSPHARLLPLAFAGPVAAVQLLALYTNARRYAVGVPGPLVFLRREEWSPPLGWVPWLVVACLAAASLVVAALWAVRSATTPPARAG